MVCGAALLLALARTARNNDGDGDGSPGEGFRAAAGGVLLVLTTYCFLNTRDGSFANPHPGL